MPRVYDHAGLRFDYPDNWEVEESDPRVRNAETEYTVTVYTPGGSFWSVVRQEGVTDATELAEAAAQVLREEYADLDGEDVDETIAGHRVIGQDLHFIFLDLTNTAQIRCVPTSRGMLLIHTQADDREFDDIEPVFQAMTTSLLRSQEPMRESYLPDDRPFGADLEDLIGDDDGLDDGFETEYDDDLGDDLGEPNGVPSQDEESDDPR